MPAYFMTLHAYRSWTEENPSGFYKRTQRGVRPPDTGLAIHRAKTATHPPRRFTRHQQQFILEQLPEIAKRRDLRLHAASCTETHLHLIVSWFGQEELVVKIDMPMAQARAIAAKVKNVLATLLSKQEKTTGNRWFSRGCDCTPIEDREHFNHLLSDYLPKHINEGGLVRLFDKGDTSK